MSKTLSGKGGRVVFSNNYCVHVHAWSADIVAEALEDTNWDWTGDDVGWKSFICGLRAWAGSFEAFLDDAQMPSPGLGVAANIIANIELWTDRFHLFKGVAVCTGTSVSHAIAGIGSVKVGFQGTLHLQATSSGSSSSSSMSASSSSASASSSSYSLSSASNSSSSYSQSLSSTSNSSSSYSQSSSSGS